MEREMEIVRLHTAGPLRGADQRLVEVVRDGARARPEEAALDRRDESLGADAAADGAEDIDRETFEQSMSIIVKHRTTSTWSPSGWG